MPVDRYAGKHLVFMGIQVWDATTEKFPIPKGSEHRPCAACAAATWVQASFLKAARRREHTILCYRCARKLGVFDRAMKDPDNVEIPSEVFPEILAMLKRGRRPDAPAPGPGLDVPLPKGRSS